MAMAGVPLFATGQVHIDKEVVLQGQTPEQRQVSGLPASTSPTDVLTAGVEQTSAHIEGTVHVQEALLWGVELPGTPSPPVPGTNILVRIPERTTSATSIMLNGHGPYLLTHQGNSPFIDPLLPAGAFLSLVFDGDGFQVMNAPQHGRRSCSPGMVAVNEEYCIDVDKRGATDFFTASSVCAAEGKRLCSWGEWYAACDRTGQLGINGMDSSFEWTNSTANGDGNVRMARFFNNCFSVGTSWSFGPPDRTYRCCMTR